jgi:hypothetical protein
MKGFVSIYIALGLSATIVLDNSQGKLDGNTDVALFEYHPDCASANLNPIDALKYNKDCWKKHVIDGDNHTIKKIKNKYYIDTKKAKEISWLTDIRLEENLFKNKWLLTLAIAARNEMNILYSSDRLLVFQHDKFGKDKIWSWYFSDNDSPPIETEFIHLKEGDTASSFLSQILIKNENRQKIVAALIEPVKRLNRGINGALSIISMLPETCLKSLPQDIKAHCDELPTYLSNSKLLSRAFDIDKTTGTLKCINDYSGGDLRVLFELKSKNSSTFYSASTKMDIVPLPAFDPRSKEEAWAQLICLTSYSDMIYQAEIRSVSGKSSDSLLVKANRDGFGILVIRFPKNDSSKRKELENIQPNTGTFLVDKLYQPLLFIDEGMQRKYSKVFNSANYKGSILETLVNHWVETTNNKSTEVFVFKSIFPANEFNKSDHALLIDEFNAQYGQLPVSILNTHALLQCTYSKVNVNKYFKIGGSILTPKPHWEGFNFEELKDPKLAAFAAWQQKSVYLAAASKSNDYVVVASDNDQLWAFKKNTENQLKIDINAFPLLKNLYGVSKNKEIEQKLVSGIKTEDSWQKELQPLLPELINRNKVVYGYMVKNAMSSNADSPLKYLGGSESIQFPPALAAALSAHSGTLVLLTGSKDGSIDLKLNKGVALNRDVASVIVQMKDPWVVWLALMGKDLRTITSDPDEKFWIFSSKDFGSKDVNGIDGSDLWSWSRIDSNATGSYGPVERSILSRKDVFLLTGESVGKKYVETLATDASDQEKEFLKSVVRKNRKFKLLDFFKGSVPIDRVLLYVDEADKESELMAHRLPANKNIPEEKIDFELIEGVAPLTWSSVATRYNRTWIRAEFEQRLVRSGESPLKTWLGPSRLGLTKGDMVGVFSMPPDRHLGFSSLSRILDKVRSDRYVYRQTSSSPSEKTLFESWVGSTWNRKEWRADPRGYFDRILAN